MKKLHIVCLSVILALSAVFTGCGSSQTETGKNQGFTVYYLNENENGLYRQIRKDLHDSPTSEEEIDQTIENCLAALQDVEERDEYLALLPENVMIQSRSLENGVLRLDFSSSYYDMGKTREVLVRAGIVRTLVQINGVGYVEFTVAGQPLTNSDGKEIGLMDADYFVENAGKQINAYLHTSITLYFSSQDGTKLQREGRSIYYSSNKPLEWAIVERIIAGPKLEGNFAAVPSVTNIIGIATTNRICYVNLSKEFLNNTLAVTEEVPIYAIVNSLMANCEVDEVQFAVEGETNVTFRDDMDLSHTYTADESLVAAPVAASTSSNAESAAESVSEAAVKSGPETPMETPTEIPAGTTAEAKQS